ncbi:hypothetical protein [uncultured Bacteroides sp.]|uniref:hypothetical protein n=1 Tax=uncultured Bacteroides sp. TaxID=162156 RepID=UPI002AABBC93|nr:hypothetical protein [uncultured Bacteroides sp.]
MTIIEKQIFCAEVLGMHAGEEGWGDNCKSDKEFLRMVSELKEGEATEKQLAKAWKSGYKIATRNRAKRNNK